MHGSGGLHFKSCHNCAIENIHWIECGSQSVSKSTSNSVIQFHKSSNIKIQGCSFKNSLGQGIVLFEVIGAVTINHCKFTSNLYEGDGTAIYYVTLNETKHSDISNVFTISNCNFSHNQGALSVVYVSSKSLGYLSLRNSTFYKNLGSPISISNAGLVIDGTVIFEENLAQRGGGISMNDHSYVQFWGNSTVIFRSNNAEFGGAIYMKYHSIMLLHQDSTVSFYTNNASLGGAVYSSYNCYMSSEENSILTFIGNSATLYGGALMLSNTSITLNNSIVTIDSNSANKAGALYAEDNCDNITITGNSVVNIDDS